MPHSVWYFKYQTFFSVILKFAATQTEYDFVLILSCEHLLSELIYSQFPSFLCEKVHSAKYKGLSSCNKIKYLKYIISIALPKDLENIL